MFTVCLALLILAGCEKPAAPAPKPDASPPIEKSAEKGPVKLTLRLSPAHPRLSDMVTLDMIVTAELDVEIKPPPFGRAVGDFLVRDFNDPPDKIENGKRVRRYHFQLEPVQAGPHLIRSFGVEFIDKRANSESKDKQILIETEPLEVTVTSELGDKTPSLADLAPMAVPQPLPPGLLSPWTIAGIAGGLSAAAAIAIVVFLRKRKQAAIAAVQRTPEEIAQAELEALMSEHLSEKGQHKDFYVRLTGIVRRYIERTTGIHAPELTTEEFLRDSRARQIFSYDRAQRLGGFLEAADMVKYAAQEPGQRQVDESVSRAREFVGLPGAFSPMHVA